MRRILLLIPCVFLAGCFFTSETPLFFVERGQCPFATPTAFVEEAPRDEGGDPARITFVADGPECVITATTEDTPARMLFVPLRRDQWIVQYNDGTSLSYTIARRSGRRLIFDGPECDHFSAARLTAAHVQSSDNSCVATNAEGLERLFRSWRRGRHEAIAVYARG